VQWEALKSHLYPTSDNQASVTAEGGNCVLDNLLLAGSSKQYEDVDGVMLGWKVLWSIMTASHKDLAGSWGKSEKLDLGKLIGAGRSAAVFKVDMNTVKKVSSYNRSNQIKNEVK